MNLIHILHSEITLLTLLPDIPGASEFKKKRPFSIPQWNLNKLIAEYLPAQAIAWTIT